MKRTSAGVEIRIDNNSNFNRPSLQIVPLDFPSDATISVIVYLKGGLTGYGCSEVSIIPSENWMLRQMSELKMENDLIRQKLDAVIKSVKDLELKVDTNAANQNAILKEVGGILDE